MVMAAAPAMPVPPSMLGRLMQGMAGVGSKLAPAYGAAKAAAPAVGGAIQGVGIGVGAAAGQAGVQTAKGLLAKPISLLRNIIPENVMGWYVLLIMVVYWYSWMAGFAAPLVLASHALLALIGFFLFVYVENSLEEGKGSLWQIVRRNGVTFSILLIIDYMLLTGQVQWNLIFITALLLAFREGSPLEDLKRVVMVLLIASAASAVVPFLYDRFNGLFFSAAAKIALPLNFQVWSLDFSYLPFILGLLLNRTFTYPFFWFAIFGLSKKTRVARSLAWIIMFLFIFASWPSIAPEVSKLHSQYVTGATPEQKEFWPNIFKQAGTNFKGAVTWLFQSFTAQKAYAYEGAYETFGFGEPKEEPKIGLQLRDDPNMPKEFNLEFYDTPTPSVIMEVPNQLPLDDPRKRVISVVDIECKDKTAGGSGGEVVKPLPKPKPDEPATYASVYYKGPKLVTCKFTSMKEGSNTAEIKVKYGFAADAEFSTAFMRRDRLEAKVLKGEDPVVKDNVPSSTAEYDNGPIAITWGDVEIFSPPVGVKAGSPLGFLLFISKTGSWEGEIAGVNSLILTTPSEFELVETNDKTCSFQKVKEKSNTEVNIYKVKEDLIKKDGTPRFIGDNVRLMCKMSVSDSLINELAGSDDDDRRRPWKGATFKASVDYLFSTEKTVSFEVKGCKSGDAKDCTTKDTKCPGKQTCNADGVWGEVCNDIPSDDCPKGGEGT